MIQLLLLAMWWPPWAGSRELLELCWEEQHHLRQLDVGDRGDPPMPPRQGHPKHQHSGHEHHHHREGLTFDILLQKMSTQSRLNFQLNKIWKNKQKLCDVLRSREPSLTVQPGSSGPSPSSSPTPPHQAWADNLLKNLILKTFSCLIFQS